MVSEAKSVVYLSVKITTKPSLTSFVVALVCLLGGCGRGRGGGVDAAIAIRGRRGRGRSGAPAGYAERRRIRYAAAAAFVTNPVGDFTRVDRRGVCTAVVVAVPDVDVVRTCSIVSDGPDKLFGREIFIEAGPA